MYLLMFILSTCQGETNSKPTPALDPKNASSLLEHAIHKTRAQSSYETSYQSLTQKPGSDPVHYKGNAVWIAPEVLYVRYSGTGKDHKKIVRVGNSTWVHYSVLDLWQSSAESGMPGAGRGIQNPDEILAAMAGHTAGARLVVPGLVELTFTGGSLARVLKGQGNARILDWDNSSAQLRIRTDAETRVKHLAVEAALQTKGPQPESLTYTAQVELSGYGSARELTFEDDLKRPIILPDDIQATLNKALPGKR